MSLPPSFPYAQQAQIIRANQRDLYHVSLLKERTESVLRSWLGTRWLTRWDREIELLVKVIYYGVTTGKSTQTLGEEYTDIWQYSTSNDRMPLPSYTRAGVVLLPTLSAYALGRLGSIPSLREACPQLGELLKRLPVWMDIISEINLAVFYLRGVYYDFVKRVLKVRYLSSIPEDPYARPPSYSLLGVFLIIRLIHRLKAVASQHWEANISPKGNGKVNDILEMRQTFLDNRPVSSFLGSGNLESEPARQDERTMLDIDSIPTASRAARNCTLCLEERTDSCSTECGHLFCWSCIVGWGREKAECPLCRQSLNLNRLLPIYNL